MLSHWMHYLHTAKRNPTKSSFYLEVMMIITEDYSYVKGLSKTLIEKGFGEYAVYMYQFDRYFSDEQKEQNRAKAEKYGTTSKEWADGCYKTHHDFYEKACEMLEAFGKNHKLYQYNCKEHDYDYFFYSNQGWNKKDWFDFCQINLDDEDVERNKKQNVELREWITNWNGDPENLIKCRIQYSSVLDKEKIAEAVEQNVHKIVDKMLDYGSRKGKIKLIESQNEYGFFKKGARKWYTPLNDSNIIGILIDQGII